MWFLLLRYGFNSDGHDVVQERLHNLRLSETKEEAEKGLLGVNLGKNKTSEDAAGDYSEGVRRFGAEADYLVINVSRYLK